MWRLLSKLLSVVGAAGLPFNLHRTRFTVGDPNSPDSEGGAGWKDFLETRRLWEAWGPVAGSPWEPFHCVTLFAALDYLNGKLRPALGPLPGLEAPPCLRATEALPAWAEQGGTMVILDLPGPEVVAAGHALVVRAGFQPVCTFDNWPNEQGVIKSERLLGALLHFAASVSRTRAGMTPASPPVWLCDAGRCGMATPPPGQYDNRYIIEDRLLPGPALLSAGGIRSVIYVGRGTAPLAASWDVHPYLAELKHKGFHVAGVAVTDEGSFLLPSELADTPARSWSAVAQTVVRSSAGGFGGFVPQPSSSG